MSSSLFTLVLPPEIAFDPVELRRAAFRKTGLNPGDSDLHLRILKRSIDSRQATIKVHVEVEIGTAAALGARIAYTPSTANVDAAAKRVVIVGAGPAGLFAALRLLELGLKPILLERGKDVRARRFDLVKVSRKGEVDPDSNYCFGEGGAGTYSDGKLFTRSTKRGDHRRVLEIFQYHGASDDILIDTHPHIGTNLLPGIIAKMRETLLRSGAEIHFETRVADLVLEGVLAPSRIRGVLTARGDRIDGDAVLLATGHSARDIYRLLHRRGVRIEAKPFALGVRVEHAQAWLDESQYRRKERGPHLPAASYRLVTQVKHDGVEKGVFSFCMCPGGFIVPAATAAGEIVVNGMSPSRRDSAFANSGIVVSVDEADYGSTGAADEPPELRALAFQASVEQAAARSVGRGFTAPGARITDFIDGKVSQSLLPTSYQPGTVPADFAAILPPAVHQRLRAGLRDFGRKLRGFVTSDAQLLGVESRTSSPVRIPRDRETFEHPQVAGLYPVAEGAGYAGGILSAAMDGERAAEAIARKLGV